MNVEISSAAAGSSAKAGLPDGAIRQTLRPLYQSARKSSSLIMCDGLQFDANGITWYIPKFMYLGARGSGVPIRVGLFSGFDAAGLNLSIALAKLTARFEMDSSSTKDYALFLYPVINPRSASVEVDAPDLDISFF